MSPARRPDGAPPPCYSKPPPPWILFFNFEPILLVSSVVSCELGLCMFWSHDFARIGELLVQLILRRVLGQEFRIMV